MGYFGDESIVIEFPRHLVTVRARHYNSRFAMLPCCLFDEVLSMISFYMQC
jgi:hypothetical protein